MESAYVVCVNAARHVDLQARRLYRVVPDQGAAVEDMVRIIDDSGDDYLYPASCFVSVELPQRVRAALDPTD